MLCDAVRRPSSSNGIDDSTPEPFRDTGRLSVEQKCSEIFALLDIDGDGLLNCSEMQSLATRTGGELSTEEYA
eukprot:SAG31_NODE_37336_length_305_cov_0.747573_1_plen_72_part_01